ncbi:uncharacterized protein LOC135204676 isoform X1 [Macrobrachium nipponense]|uniref:uncharacterized protein LOC135204676 isoform X1 n=1 Tax=Macrobrachium nipponense TaxID=159736 RepID=UPI0030C83871
MAEHTGTNLPEGSGGLEVEEGNPDTVGESEVHVPQKLSEEEKREIFRKAVAEVEAGISIRQIAKKYSISRSTLSKRIQMGLDNGPKSSAMPWLSADVEREIVDWCLEMARIGHPQTKQSLPLVVQRILNQKKKKIFQKENLPTHGWITRFLKRHPELSNRIPENLGPLRASITSKKKGTLTLKTVSSFFQNLQSFLVAEGLNANEFLSPDNASRVFTCNNTGIVISAQDGASKVWDKKGTVASCKVSEKGKPMTTVLCCASADGSLMRPFIVNKGKTPTEYVKHQDLEADSYHRGCSDSGLMTADLFHDWLGNIFENELVKKNIRRPVLLILDGFLSYLNWDTLRFARDKKILMYHLPPYSSHVMQPLDVSVLKPLKAEYRRVYNKVWGEISSKDMPMKHFPYILMKSIKEVNIPENIISGFQSTGLVPFNPNAIDASVQLLETSKVASYEEIRKALAEVEAGSSIRQIARKYSIARCTITKYLRLGLDKSPQKGVPWLPADVERDIVDWCLEMARIGHPQIKQSLLLVVQHTLNQKKKKIFPNENIPTHGWTDRFLKRHPEVANQLSENLGQLKGTLTSKTISTFFQNLQTFLVAEGLNADGFLSPYNGSRVFTCSETGIVISSQDGTYEVCDNKGTQAACKVSGMGKPMINVLCCASADGSLMSPFIINKGKTVSVYVKHHDMEADSYRRGCSDSGLMTADLFHDWLGNIFENELVKKNIRRPVLLILDGSLTHLNLDTLRFARDKKILIYYLPPYSSHVMQPLDVSVFKPLKAEYRRAYNKVWGKLSSVDMPKKHFPYVLLKAIKEVNIPENIISGFRSTGLVPFNHNAIDTSEFVTAEKEEDTFPVQLSETSTVTSVVEPTSYASYEEIFNQGFIMGQRAQLKRLEAVVPQDELALYKTRKTDLGRGRSPSTSYMVWKELEMIKPCPAERNPYAGETQPLADASEIAPFPQAFPSKSGLQYQLSSSDISLPGPSGIPSATTPPGIAERTSDSKRYLKINERKKRLFEEKKEQHKKEREAKKLARGSKAKGRGKARALPKRKC